MNRISLALAAFGIAFILFGCSPTASVSMLSTNQYPPLEQRERVRLTTADIEESYEELAIVSVRGEFFDSEVGSLNQKLIEEARAIGANAVIRISYGSTGGQYSLPTATGTAVRIATE